MEFLSARDRGTATGGVTEATTVDTTGTVATDTATATAIMADTAIMRTEAATAAMAMDEITAMGLTVGLMVPEAA